MNLQRVKLINSGQFESAGLPAVSFTVDQLMLEKVADVRSFIISAPEFVGSGESFSVGLKLVDAEGNVVDYAGDCALEVKDVITGSLTAQENVRLASGQGTSSSLLLSEGVYAISASGSALGKVTVNVIAASSQAMLIESFEGNFGDRWWKNSASGYSAQTSSVEGYSGQAMEISFPATEGVWSQVVSKENVLKGNLWPKASGLLSFWAKGDGESTPVTVILSAQGGLSFISSFIPGAASWHKTLLPLSAFREKNSGRALTAADFPNLVYLFFTSSNLPAFSFSVDELAVEIEMPKLTVTYPDRISAGETAAFTVTAVGNDGQTLGDFNSLMAIRALNLYAQTDDGIEVALSSFASGVAQGTLKATRGGIWEIVISDSQIPVISTSLRILVSGQSAIAAPPEVISPLSQAVLAAGDQVTFSWKPVADAVQYLIELSWESDFAESLVENVNADAFTYVFTALPPGKTSGTLYWRIAALDSQTFSGPFAKGSLTILEDATGGLLESKGGIVTKQVFRPGQGLLSFGYFLTQDAQVTIQIRSLRGQLVRTIVQNVPRSAGSNLADSWDGLDQKGRVVPPGPYLVVLTFRNDRNVTVGRAARAFVVSK